MNNKALIIGIFLIAIGSFFLGSFSYQSMKYPLTIKTIPTTNLQPSGPNKINEHITTQTVTQTKEIPPSYIEIPNKGWVTIGSRYFSYDWKGPMMGMHEVHYCGIGMTWDGFSVNVGLTINVIGWGEYKITDMNEGYICLTLIP